MQLYFAEILWACYVSLLLTTMHKLCCLPLVGKEKLVKYV